MTVQFVKVKAQDDDIRLDRWFARHYPTLKNGQLQRLLRAKNIKVNNQKATASQHLFVGDEIRIPPLTVSEKSNLPRDLSKADVQFMKSLVLYKDKDVIVLNKPAGIAVQGGSKTERHIDGLLDALRFELDEKPHLVHRLDKDTSGILVIGRTANAGVLRHLKSPTTSRLQRLPMGRERQLSGCNLVERAVQTSLCHNRRLLLFERSCRSISRVGEELFASRLSLRIQTVERCIRHKYLAPNLELGRVVARKSQRNGADGANIGGNIVATLAIASGNGTKQLAILVGERYGCSVELQLADKLRFALLLLDALDELVQTLNRVGVRQREHRVAVLHILKLRGLVAAHSHRWRVLVGILGVSLLQLDKTLHHLVELEIGNLGCILHIIFAIMVV